MNFWNSTWLDQTCGRGTVATTAPVDAHWVRSICCSGQSQVRDAGGPLWAAAAPPSRTDGSASARVTIVFAVSVIVVGFMARASS